MACKVRTANLKLQLRFFVKERKYKSRGALPYKPIRDVPFFRVSVFSINSLTEYEN